MPLHLNLSHLELFQELAQTRSFSKAAQARGLSQSAASQHVQDLESLLGVLVIDRSRRPFELTPAGELYLAFCRDVVLRRGEFEVALGELKEKTEGTVRVAAIYSVGLTEMARLEAEFAQLYPGVRLEVSYLHPARIYEALAEGRADLGIVSYPESTAEVTAEPWREEEMVVAMNPRHPLARRRDVVPFELNGVDFVAFEEDLPIRKAIDQYLSEQLVEVNVTMQFDNLAAIKEAIGVGTAVSIVPRPVVEADVRQGRLAVAPLGPP
ncbi:MAG: LysR family transcriptional regulator, partial [Bryobacteraceae bacterium]|nr:LysR family transcriptional regulator [Bryobacteraceae bacterium]